MKASTLRKITQFPLIPNRIVKWVNQNKNYISYPELPLTVSTSVCGFSRKFEIRNFQDLIQSNIYFRGFYEIRESKIFKKILKPGDTFIDVGANLGWYTVLAAKIVGVHGKVIALEPSNKVYSHLHKNIEINSLINVQLEKIALSDTNGTASFSGITETNEGIGSLIPKPEGIPSTVVEEVQTQKFDDLFSINEMQQIKLIKIDVEGAEMLVIKGMLGTLRQKKIDNIIIEVSDYHLKRIGSSSDEVFKILEDCGYRLSIIKYHPMNRYSLKPYKSYKANNSMFFGNVLAQAN